MDLTQDFITQDHKIFEVLHENVHVIKILTNSDFYSQGDHCGNLVKHVERNHKDRHPTLARQINEWKAKRAKKKTTKASEIKVVMCPRRLKLACVRMVAVHGRPFEMMNDAAFQDIIQPYLSSFPARER